MTIKSVLDPINNLLDGISKPTSQIPPLLISIAGLCKPGLSAIKSTGNVIAKMNEIGIETGPAPDGSQNQGVALVNAIFEEMYRAMRQDANIQLGVPVGGAGIIGFGANSGGPVIIHGFNINPVGGSATIL